MKEKHASERTADALEEIGKQLKRSNDIELAKADHQHKTQTAMLAMVEPIIKNILAQQEPSPGKAPKRGKRRGKIIQLRRP